MHDWLDLALGVLVSACGWLVVRFVGNIDSLSESQEAHSRQLRDTRQAISRIEGHLDLDPFPYRD